MCDSPTYCSSHLNQPEGDVCVLMLLDKSAEELSTTQSVVTCFASNKQRLKFAQNVWAGQRYTLTSKHLKGHSRESVRSVPSSHLFHLSSNTNLFGPDMHWGRCGFPSIIKSHMQVNGIS